MATHLIDETVFVLQQHAVAKLLIDSAYIGVKSSDAAVTHTRFKSFSVEQVDRIVTTVIRLVESRAITPTDETTETTGTDNTTIATPADPDVTSTVQLDSVEALTIAPVIQESEIAILNPKFYFDSKTNAVYIKTDSATYTFSFFNLVENTFDALKPCLSL